MHITDYLSIVYKKQGEQFQQKERKRKKMVCKNAFGWQTQNLCLEQLSTLSVDVSIYFLKKTLNLERLFLFFYVHVSNYCILVVYPITFSEIVNENIKNRCAKLSSRFVYFFFYKKKTQQLSSPLHSNIRSTKWRKE